MPFILREQVEKTLSADHYRRFKRRAAVRIRADRPDAVERLGDDRSEDLISRACDHAPSLMLRSERQRRVYAEACVVIGRLITREDPHSELVRTLEDDELDPDERAERLLELAEAIPSKTPRA